eukprot:SAG31_NODE_86_length_26973_cov_16.850897_34_plen_97_part_00
MKEIVPDHQKNETLKADLPTANPIYRLCRPLPPLRQKMRFRCAEYKPSANKMEDLKTLAARPAEKNNTVLNLARAYTSVCTCHRYVLLMAVLLVLN